MKEWFIPFKYSIVLFISLVVWATLFYNVNLIPETLSLVNLFQLNYFVLAGLSCYIAALSFAIPYLKFKKHSLKQYLVGIMKYVYIDSSGGDADSFISEFAGVSKGKVAGIKTADLSATILISSFLSLFLVPNLMYFFFVVIAIELILFIFLVKLGKMPFDLESLPYNIARYLLEFPRTIFTFYAASLFLNPAVVFCLLTTSSAVYFVPKFRGAGGLLSLYLMIFTTFIGLGPLHGLFVAILFRINGIAFFSLPLYLIKRCKT